MLKPVNLMRFIDIANSSSETNPVFELEAPVRVIPVTQPPADERPRTMGKFLAIGDRKFYVRGVTYGTFKPNGNGSQYPDARIVNQDFAAMKANGLNAVRTYTVPPNWLLDTAQRHGLYVMVGLPWEQHVAFLEEKERAAEIEDRLATAVRGCAGHPAILAYAVGNEIPAPIVRWHGHQRVERYLERLYNMVKTIDAQALVTYVNYPTTEYLHLPFLDFVTFNVYLESEERLRAYVARLQNIAGDRPLIMSEVGLDSRRNGELRQAKTLDWQIRAVFSGGCAGAFVFAWTDEWYRGGYDIEDWDFGLTTRDRKTKAALLSVRKAFNDVPLAKDSSRPSISVVVCSYNGSRTLPECLEALKEIRYPKFEVIIVNDGSTDTTEQIARNSGFRVITTDNHGLSHARNVGLHAATGEIVAYIDDDAYPDSHWLDYLAYSFTHTKHAGIGGPNIPPANDGAIAECVARSPGGPVHVLVSDEEAEHIPGCNMAFRKAALLEIGGFDEQFRSAGDDVDICWRLQERGFTLGFNPAALVWHHRRNSVFAYWRQQIGYGKAEALLERKWPEKYNAAGHLTWGGRVYGNGHTFSLGRAWRIYHGMWGTAPFQSRHETQPGLLLSLPLMPEWYLVILALGWLCLLGTLWQPLFLLLPLLVASVVAPIAQALVSSNHAIASRDNEASSRGMAARVSARCLTGFLHLIQPLARLGGRLSYDLSPWRKRGVSGAAVPRPRVFSLWSESWQSTADRLHVLKEALRVEGASVALGHDYANWDLEVRDGTFGAVRLRMAIEEHGANKQLVRLGCWPICSLGVVVLALIFLGLSTCAILSHAWLASVALAGIGLILSLHIFQDCATASAAVMRTLRQNGFAKAR